MAPRTPRSHDFDQDSSAEQQGEQSQYDPYYAYRTDAWGGIEEAQNSFAKRGGFNPYSGNINPAKWNWSMDGIPPSALDSLAYAPMGLYNHPGSGGFGKDEFLDMLRPIVEMVAHKEFQGTGYTSVDCPIIEHWFEYAHKRDDVYVERGIQRWLDYIPETSALEYIPLIVDRIQSGIRHWLKTGEVTADPSQATNQLSNSDLGYPDSIDTSLGRGENIPPALRSRLDELLEASAQHIRIHQGNEADKLAKDQGAAAFTVGRDVVLGSGVDLNTLTGQGILAHEALHAQQQGFVDGTRKSLKQLRRTTNSAESDAERATGGLIARAFGIGRKSNRLGSAADSQNGPMKSAKSISQHIPSSAGVSQGAVTARPSLISRIGSGISSAGIAVRDGLSIAACTKTDTNSITVEPESPAESQTTAPEPTTTQVPPITTDPLTTSTVAAPSLSAEQLAQIEQVSSAFALVNEGFTGLFLEGFKEKLIQLYIQDPQKAAALVTKLIEAVGSPEALLSFVPGLLEGFFVDGFVGLLEFIWIIASHVSPIGMLYQAATTDMEEVGRELHELIKEFEPEIAAILLEILNKQEQIFASLITPGGFLIDSIAALFDPENAEVIVAITAAISNATKDAGSSFAEAIYQYMETNSVEQVGADYGELNGRIIGFLLFTVLTSIPTFGLSGIGTAVVSGGRLFRAIGQATLNLGRGAITAISKMLSTIAKSITKLGNTGILSKLGNLLERIATKLLSLVGKAIDEVIQLVMLRLSISEAEASTLVGNLRVAGVGDDQIIAASEIWQRLGVPAGLFEAGSEAELFTMMAKMLAEGHYAEGFLYVSKAPQLSAAIRTETVRAWLEMNELNIPGFRTLTGKLCPSADADFLLALNTWRGASWQLRFAREVNQTDTVTAFESSDLGGERFIDILTQGRRRIQCKSWQEWYQSTFAIQFEKDVTGTVLRTKDANGILKISWAFEENRGLSETVQGIRGRMQAVIEEMIEKLPETSNQRALLKDANTLIADPILTPDLILFGSS